MNDADLSRRFALAAHELRAQVPPATLLPAIHRRLDRDARKARASRRLAWAGWAGLSTACAALAMALVVNSILDIDVPDTTVATNDGFVTLVNNEVWQRASADTGRTWLVSTELPHSRLAVLGLPYDPARAGERVPAQFLMHSSGEVLAVRVNR
jgi:predicted anti-sigma-YlaC factor YlaD